MNFRDIIRELGNELGYSNRFTESILGQCDREDPLGAAQSYIEIPESELSEVKQHARFMFSHGETTSRAVEQYSGIVNKAGSKN